jgi:hypothetical protein
MSDERVVFQTKHGDIEFGFYPDVSKQQEQQHQQWQQLKLQEQQWQRLKLQ